jgi:hypothetical protein
MFALAGDRMGIWDPLEPAPLPAASSSAKKHHRAGGTARHRVRASPSRRVATSEQPGIGPPVPADSAFLLAAVAACLAALISVPGRRLLRRGFHGGLGALASRPLDAARGSRRRLSSRGFHGGPDALASRPLDAARRSRSWNWSVSGWHPRLPRPANVAFASAVARRGVQVGATLLETAKAERRRSRASSPSSSRAATGAALRSRLTFSSAELGNLVQIVNRGRRPARAALRATAFRFRRARVSFIRHRTDVAPYVISMVVSVVFGWLVAVLINQ